MLKVENTYKNSFRNFSMVKNYIYEGNNDIEELGILKNDIKFHTVYILQDRKNKNLAYRIYQGFERKNFDKKEDAVLIQRLYEYGGNIKKIDFPYGVITRDNHIIGQVIPYYENAIELASFKEKTETPRLLLEAYSLLKELYRYHIYYLDIHEYNFLMTSYGIKLIDFDNEMTKFSSYIDGVNGIYERHMVSNFRKMMNTLLGYYYNSNVFGDMETMKDLEEKVWELQADKPKIKIKK